MNEHLPEGTSDLLVTTKEFEYLRQVQKQVSSLVGNQL